MCNNQLYSVKILRSDGESEKIICDNKHCKEHYSCSDHAICENVYCKESLDYFIDEHGSLRTVRNTFETFPYIKNIFCSKDSKCGNPDCLMCFYLENDYEKNVLDKKFACLLTDETEHVLIFKEVENVEVLCLVARRAIIDTIYRILS